MHALDLGRVGARGALPTQFQDVPIAARASDVFQPGGKRLLRIGTNRPVERTPVVQREGEHAEPADSGGLAADHQRQDARRTVAGQHDQHAECLSGAEVPPVDFQPLERLEKRSPRGLAKQAPPLLAEPGQLVDLVDFQHLGAMIKPTSQLY